MRGIGLHACRFNCRKGQALFTTIDFNKTNARKETRANLVNLARKFSTTFKSESEFLDLAGLLAANVLFIGFVIMFFLNCSTDSLPALQYRFQAFCKHTSNVLY